MESSANSVVGEQDVGKSNLTERPRPLGEDVSLTESVTHEALQQAQPSSIINRVFKVAFLGWLDQHPILNHMYCLSPSSGDSGVGKSSLILRLCEGRFNASCISTLGLDFSTKMLTVGDERVVFQLWDTAGQERSAKHHAIIGVCVQ